MAKQLIVLLVCLVLCGCATSRDVTYVSLVMSDFVKSDNYRENGLSSVKVEYIEQDKSLSQLIDQSGLAIESSSFDGYDMINYMVSYSGSYWLETYQVFRACDKSGCKHRFLLVRGIYA